MPLANVLDHLNGALCLSLLICTASTHAAVANTTKNICQCLSGFWSFLQLDLNGPVQVVANKHAQCRQPLVDSMSCSPLRFREPRYTLPAACVVVMDGMSPFNPLPIN